jgi:hypothetical protein
MTTPNPHPQPLAQRGEEAAATIAKIEGVIR